MIHIGGNIGGNSHFVTLLWTPSNPHAFPASGLRKHFIIRLAIVGHDTYHFKTHSRNLNTKVVRGQSK